MPTAPARPDGRVFKVSSAKLWKWMVSWEGYSSAKVRNHTMKITMTMLNKVSLEYRCVAKLYRIFARMCTPWNMIQHHQLLGNERDFNKTFKSIAKLHRISACMCRQCVASLPREGQDQTQPLPRPSRSCTILVT